MAQKMTGARLFAQTLAAYGVTHVFFMDAVLRRALAEMEDCGITRILGHSAAEYRMELGVAIRGPRCRTATPAHCHVANPPRTKP